MRPRYVLLLSIAAFVLGAVSAAEYGARQLASTKVFADSVQASKHVSDSLATRWADSVRAAIVAEAPKTQVRIHYVEAKSASEDSLRAQLATAKTAADSLPNLVAQVANLRGQNDTLKAQVRQDTLNLWRAMQRGDSLQRVVYDDAAAMLAVRQKIDALNAPRLPKFVHVSLEVAKDVALVWLGTKLK